jgi:hypothetical protein
MNLEQLNEWASAEFGGPAIGALPAFFGDKIRPHKGGGGGGGTTTTTQSIPNELKPLASAYADKAMNLSSQPYQGYGWEMRHEGLNKDQNAGLDMMANRAQSGSQTIDNAEAALNRNIQGGQTNPYLDQMVGKAQDSVRSQFNTGAVNSGSFGNSGLQEQFQKGLSDTATSMYGQAYDGDKARQMQSIGMAQQFGNQDYADAEQLLKSGQVKQDQNQQTRDFWYQQNQEEQNLPYKQLAAMSGVFGTNLGSTSTSSQKGGGGK